MEANLKKTSIDPVTPIYTPGICDSLSGLDIPDSGKIIFDGENFIINPLKNPPSANPINCEAL